MGGGGAFLGKNLIHNMGAFLDKIFSAYHGGIFRQKFSA